MTGKNPKAQVDVAIIIVSYNSEKYIRQCVATVQDKFAGGAYSSSIVVVDNASTDNTRLILAELEHASSEIRIIHLDNNIGFGPANNIGFRAVFAGYYVLINADAWLIANSISPVIEAMRSNSNIAVCGLPLVFPDGSPQTYVYRFSSWQRWLLKLLGVGALVAKLVRVPCLAVPLAHLSFGREFVLNHSRPKLTIKQITEKKYSGDLRSADWVCGAAMVIAGDFIRESGGFDPALFLYGEDEDLCIAAHRSGRAVAVADVAPVVHFFGWSVNRFNRHVADSKFRSLHYFIQKDIKRPLDRFIIRALLPFYVYGWCRFYLAYSVNLKNV